MGDNWYYVLEGERKGPAEISDLFELIGKSLIGPNDYVWKKGFDNWMKIKDVEEFNASSRSSTTVPPQFGEVPESLSNKGLKEIAGIENTVYVKIGADRGGEEVEYGPFSLTILKRLYDEKRINGKTFAYAKGMNNWMLLADFKDFSEVFEELPPMIDDQDRRIFGRKPFIARMFIQSYDKVFEGICRDISVGGMQVLVDSFPGKAGESISINVHPENTEHHFVAEGEIVRLLEGGQGFSFRFLNLGGEAVASIKNYLEDA